MFRYSQTESGLDTLVISECYDDKLDCWNVTKHENAISSPDLMTYLASEYKAFVLFLKKWDRKL